MAEPLGADFHIGLPAAEFARVAELDTAAVQAEETSTGELAARVARGEPDHAALAGTARWRRAELGASNGHGNARSVARVLSVLAQGGELDGVRLVSGATLDRIFEVQAHGTDLVLGTETRFGIGYGLPCAGMPLGRNDRTFFWAGWGGSMAVVDVANEMVVAYVMNRMLTGDDLRAIRVVFAAHAAVGSLGE